MLASDRKNTHRCNKKRTKTKIMISLRITSGEEIERYVWERIKKSFLKKVGPERVSKNQSMILNPGGTFELPKDLLKSICA